ncbi:MAG: xanthine phosphoribosyltransferase [Solobacterium sp.]|nr:xanthine phosphoribosyltransferase [Solobacterium sp.]
MKELEEKILAEGRVFEGNVLKIDSFLNHQIDVELCGKIGEEFHRIFSDRTVDKILTVEASGIAYAVTTAQQFGNIPIVYAKKGNAKNMDKDRYTADAISFTRGGPVTFTVAKEYLIPGEHVLIIDDFLATGEAVSALIEITRQAGADIVGCGTVVEKSFQPGRKRIEAQGIEVCSLARIKEMTPQGIVFED